MAHRCEILAPAGNYDNLIAAVYSGANAVYLGVQSFNARASAANFSFEELKKAVGFCHARNVKVNVTLNTILYDRELPRFVETVKKIAESGADAIITQDLAAAEIIRNVAPDIALHGSTQMAVHSLRGALLLKEKGYKRVILARECSLEEVEYITKNCGIETEIFVHGALCMSVSGQCYASAFLGGRSGNRGRCAGTCRLPMSARGKTDDYHLSLKDLCAMEMLPQIEKIGVACVKIEGRLRTPEYVAAAVDSAVKAVEGRPFDKEMLSDVFSRSGFTNGFLEKKLDGSVFGVRTKEDADRTKTALPKIRELYRREGRYVPVTFNFEMNEHDSRLSVTDGIHTVSQTVDAEPTESDRDFTPAVRTALSKLGGTPFYCESAEIKGAENRYIPVSAINAVRREAVGKLLAEREKVRPHKVYEYEIPAITKRNSTPKFIARFENRDQIPYGYEGLFDYIILPTECVKSADEAIKEKLVAELPRDIFGKEENIKKDIKECAEYGIDKFCVQNIGHIPLVKGYEIFSSFTLNISNSLSAAEYKKLGVSVMTVSPEITLSQIGAITADVKTSVIGYGHIPLMTVKSCPMHNVKTCKGCDGKGFLTDRKGKKLPLLCHGKISGYREIFNPVPLYLGDKRRDINADYTELRFSVESKNEVKRVIDKFMSGEPLGTEFTRGLYYKASI